MRKESKKAKNKQEPLINYGGFWSGTPGRNDKRRLMKAVENIAKTETGRHLLNRANALGYTVYYDESIRESDDAQGMCWSDPRKISVVPGLEIHKLAILLVHEMAHAVYFHDLKTPELQMHPNQILMRDHAMEADARAHEAAFVMEFAFNSVNSIQYHHVLNDYIENTPYVAAAAVKALLSHERFDQETKKDVMRAAFDAYYLRSEHRDYYEQRFLKNQNWKEFPDSMLNRLGLTATFNKVSRGLVESFLHIDKPYLDGSANYKPVDFTSSYYCGLTRTGMEYMQEQYKGLFVKPSLTEYFKTYVFKEDKTVTDDMRIAVDAMVREHRRNKKAPQSAAAPSL